MNIGFDAKRLFFNKTGLGVYSRSLINNLNLHYPENSYYLFAKKALKSPFFEEFKNDHILGPRYFSPFWRTIGLTQTINQAGCDIYHGLSHELPLGIDRVRTKTIVTIHDVIFLKYPSMYSWWDRNIYWQKWKYSCKVADRILAVSEHTKKDIISYFKVPKHKISVVPPICNIDFFQENYQKKLEEQDLDLPRNYFLYVGAINERKNLMGVINALSVVHPTQRLHLVVVGTGSEYEKKVRKQIKDYNLEKWISFRSHVPNERLPQLYQRAIALIYPSFYEGFGIPVVESLASGTPVITSSLSSLPEAAGPGAIFIDPADPESIAQAMTTLHEDRDFGKRLAEAGQRYIQKFSGKNIAKKIIEIYQGL